MEIRINRSLGGAFLTAVFLGLAGVPLYAQQTTERYIPIGKSPGISGEYSYQGKIRSMDTETRTLVVEDERGRHTFQLTEDTSIWLDGSSRRRATRLGDVSDCRAGREIELMYTKGDPKVARWIKIKAP